MDEKQCGVIIRPVEDRDSRDFVRGFTSAITPVVNMPNRDWIEYLPTYIAQKYKFDCNNCTGFSFSNTFETQMNWLVDTGVLAGEALKWFQDNGYFDEHGSFAISERFAGIMAGTTVNGNSPFLVWKAAAKYGILPRKDLSYTMDQSLPFTSQAMMCGDYYRRSEVTDAMLQKAKNALSLLTIQYEWIGGEFNAQTPSAAILEALKQAPVQICVPVCLPGWNASSVAYCSIHEADHAVTLYGDNTDGHWDIYDHYMPDEKLLSKDYYIPQAVLGVITPVPASPVIPPGTENQAPTQAELSAWQKIIQWISEKIASINSAGIRSSGEEYSIWNDIIEEVKP